MLSSKVYYFLEGKEMFKRIPVRKAGLTLPDIFAIVLLFAFLAAIVSVARYWSGAPTPPAPVDLSLSSLPKALFLSLSRIFIAYVVCLLSSLAIGYWAAHSKLAEKIIVPLIDIGQSIPVLAFLPGLNLAFLALFPESRVGLEIVAILTLYTGMAWNLMLSFYSSIKTIPREYVDIIRAYGYGRVGILLRLEIPYAMNGIIWNSMLSVAGGWFFLTICESYTLGSQTFSLIGMGSFMKAAGDRGDVTALLVGGGVMLFVLVMVDALVWNPLLRWAQRFQRMQSLSEEEDDEPVLNFFSKSKRITSFIRKMRRRYAVQFYVTQRRGKKRRPVKDWRWAGYLTLLALGAFGLWGLVKSAEYMMEVPHQEWLQMAKGAGWTFLRVNLVLLLSGLIMVPTGLWLGSRPHLVKRLQPVIQVVAAFPAPMLFPVFMMFFLAINMPLNIGSIFLMMFGAQWYLLFNVISGVAGVPPHLVEVARTTGLSKMGIIRRVYLPGAFPPILTGFLTAAGGAWNTSIVAEYVVFREKEMIADGLGSYIAVSTYKAQYPQLVAAVAVMVLLIVLINRLFWARLYTLAESKYRLDG
jgi:NitT/TauT family transport system permease protein